jgi:hypothetical protein
MRYFAPSSEQPRTCARGAIDALTQASIVELFAAHGIALAPLPRSAGPTISAIPDASVAVRFNVVGATRQAGRLTLSLPMSLLEQMRAGDATSVRLDWARELANQLTGRIKNRLLPFGVRIDVGSPSPLESQQLKEQLNKLDNLRVYLGRTLRGQVLATLHGLPDDSSLKYVEVSSPEEGTLILFE